MKGWHTLAAHWHFQCFTWHNTGITSLCQHLHSHSSRTIYPRISITPPLSLTAAEHQWPCPGPPHASAIPEQHGHTSTSLGALELRHNQLWEWCSLSTLRNSVMWTTLNLKCLDREVSVMCKQHDVAEGREQNVWSWEKDWLCFTLRCEQIIKQSMGRSQQKIQERKIIHT